MASLSQCTQFVLRVQSWCVTNMTNMNMYAFLLCDYICYNRALALAAPTEFWSQSGLEWGWGDRARPEECTEDAPWMTFPKFHISSLVAAVSGALELVSFEWSFVLGYLEPSDLKGGLVPPLAPLRHAPTLVVFGHSDWCLKQSLLLHARFSWFYSFLHSPVPSAFAGLSESDSTLSVFIHKS